MIRKESSVNAIQQQFKSDLQSLYHAKVSEVDFITKGQEARAEANAWVRSATHGLIRSIMDAAPSPDSRAVIMNAVYFKGHWRKPFVKSATANRTFYGHVSNASVPFMMHFQTQFPHKYLQINGVPVQALEMAYVNDSLSMVVLLPDAHDGLHTILSSNRSRSDLLFALEAVRHFNETRGVNVLLPKFKLDTDVQLESCLQSLGARDLFNSNVADLSGINGMRNLYVSSVKHKGQVRVDEEGTEAAAVTSVNIATTAFVPSIDLTVDHPFLFLIRDRDSGLVLFIGKVEQL